MNSELLLPPPPLPTDVEAIPDGRDPGYHLLNVEQFLRQEPERVLREQVNIIKRFLLENHDSQLWNMEIQGKHFITQHILKIVLYVKLFYLTYKMSLVCSHI